MVQGTETYQYQAVLDLYKLLELFNSLMFTSINLW